MKQTMNKQTKNLVSIAVLLVSFGLGFLLANFFNSFSSPDTYQKPVVDIKEKRDVIDENTQIIYEQKYMKCGHLIIKEFSDREIIEGKTLPQIRQIYTPQNKYKVEYDNNLLIIHQEINDWCPEDKDKCRLKEYQGRVAIYKGPNADNDILFKVTSINIEVLPIELQNKIRNSEWEFKDINALNDALENLDEYL